MTSLLMLTAVSAFGAVFFSSFSIFWTLLCYGEEPLSGSTLQMTGISVAASVHSFK